MGVSQRTTYQFVIFKSLGVDSFRVHDTSVPFDDTDTTGTVSVQVTASVKADITETLNDKGFSSKASFQSDHVHVIIVTDEVVDTVVYTLQKTT